jgi:hypothetical protein
MIRFKVPGFLSELDILHKFSPAAWAAGEKAINSA